MKYINADDIFPEELLKEMQKHIQGQIVYIPKPKGIRKKWGERSGNRAYLKHRNQEINKKFSIGTSINQLAEEFCLSVYSIRKIVYSKNVI